MYVIYIIKIHKERRRVASASPIQLWQLSVGGGGSIAAEALNSHHTIMPLDRFVTSFLSAAWIWKTCMWRAPRWVSLSLSLTPFYILVHSNRHTLTQQECIHSFAQSLICPSAQQPPSKRQREKEKERGSFHEFLNQSRITREAHICLCLSLHLLNNGTASEYYLIFGVIFIPFILN